MKTYLINLDRSRDRLAFMNDQFERLGVDVERIPAVDGSKLTRKEVEAYARERPAAAAEAWSRGQIGAFLSHAAVWRRIVSGDAAVAAVL